MKRSNDDLSYVYFPKKYYIQTRLVIIAKLTELSTKKRYLLHKRIYLTCYPIKIVKHKNPLEFLGSAQKYTFSFKDSTGDVFTFTQKTLSEILSGLHDLGHVQSDGAEGALGAMMLAFKENELIENNEDIGYTGFFLDKDKTKIVASGIEPMDPSRLH